MTEEASADRDRPNQQSLEELCRLLRFSQGEFELILAVCNSTQHRQTLVSQLRQQCPIPLDEITLNPASPNLFTTLRNQIADPPPQALMVYGLDGVQALDSVLSATNQIREEFRQFPFPLVLWLTDNSLKQLIRTAPDFYTWGNSITFETPPAYFRSFLDDLIQDVWQQVLKSPENRFLTPRELNLSPGSPRSRELETSLAVLANRRIELPPAQSADLAFVQGRIADNNKPIAREHYERSLDEWKALLSQADGRAEPDARWRENRGHVQFYLGLWWRNRAERDRRGFAAACTQARDYFAAAVQTSETAQQPNFATKYINYWAEALHRLDQWEALETVATKALTFHQSQGNAIRQARAEGFLAEVALARNDWSNAQRPAEFALALIPPLNLNLDQVSPDDAAFYAWVNSFHRSWYLFSLGKAQFGQDQINAAVQTLEQARTITQPEYDPKLYSSVLEQLRQGYFQQGKYLQAFETRRHKDAIESRFNYRAFVGAGATAAETRNCQSSLACRRKFEGCHFYFGA